jgi:alpha-1,6-mannosyltransferase
MKVLDVTEFYSQRGGGVRSHLFVKNQYLCQRHVEHRVLAPGPQDRVRLQWGRSTGSAPVHVQLPTKESEFVDFLAGPRMPYDASYSAFLRPDRIRGYVAKLRPDILEIHSPYVAAAGALLAPRSAFGARTMMWHSDFIDTYEGVLQAKHPQVARLATPGVGALWAWVRTLTAACDATIVAAAHQKQKLEAHGCRRVHFLPFGVDKACFSPGKRDASKRPNQTVVFVAIGRFAIEKRWDVVLDAYRMLRRELSVPSVLWVFGDGPERERLLRDAPEGTRFFRFEQDREVLATHLASADILLHGCPYETFGLGVAEALAAGVCAALPDQGGAAAWTHLPSVRCYPSLSARSLADCAAELVRIPESERRHLGATSATQVRSEADHFDELLALYQELLQVGRP